MGYEQAKPIEAGCKAMILPGDCIPERLQWQEVTAIRSLRAEQVEGAQQAKEFGTHWIIDNEELRRIAKHIGSVGRHPSIPEQYLLRIDDHTPDNEDVEALDAMTLGLKSKLGPPGQRYKCSDLLLGRVYPKR